MLTAATTNDVFSQRLALTLAYVHAEGLTVVGDPSLAQSACHQPSGITRSWKERLWL